MIRLVKIQIDNYGIFTNREVGPFLPGFNLIIGPNEAGKSTLLNFINGILFGFSAVRVGKKSNDYRIYQKDKLGGHLEISTGGFNQNLIVRRHSNRGSGTLSLSLTDGAPVEENYLESIFGHQDVFSNLYAFSLFELSNLESLNNERLQARIYSAGMGTGAVVIPELMKELDNEITSLFKPRGSAQPLNECLKKLEEIEKELGELSKRSGDYDRLCKQREELRLKLEQEEQQEEQVLGKLERERSYQRSWQSWRDYSRAKTDLDQLPEVPEDFPLRAIEKLDELNKRIKELQDKIREKQDQIDGEKSGFVLDEKYEKILQNIEKIVGMERGLDHFKSAVGDLPGCRIALESAGQKLDRQLKELNPDWSVNELESFDSSVTAREKLGSLREKIEKAEKAALSAELAFKEAEGHKETEKLEKPNPLFAVTAIVLLVAGVWSLYANNLKEGLLFAALGILSGAGWIFDFRKKKKVWQMGLESMDSQLQGRREAYQKAEDELKKAKQEFADFRSSLGLDPVLGPDTVGDVFNRVERARDTLENITEQQKRVESIHSCIDKYCLQAGGIFESLDENVPEPEEITGAVKLLLDQKEKAMEYDNKKQKFEQRIELYSEQLLSLKKEMEALLEQKKELISLGGNIEDASAAEEKFLRDADTAGKREVIQESINREYSKIVSEAGSEEQFIEFTNALKSHSMESIEEGIIYLEQEKKQLKEEMDRIKHELGEISNELENLGAETRSSELRLEKSVGLELLKKLATEWAARKLVFYAITKAAKRYEKERQPGVLRNGQAFLEKITGGQYVNIYSPLGEQRFEVIRKDSVKLPPEKLSRGTAEQLYLALRFGLIREMSSHHEALPVIMDDVLVNFDPARAGAACEAIMEMAETHQIIYFSCHPHTDKMFSKINKNINILEL